METFTGDLKEILGVTFWPHNKSFIDQACSVKMADDLYELRSRRSDIRVLTDVRTGTFGPGGGGGEGGENFLPGKCHA